MSHAAHAIGLCLSLVALSLGPLLFALRRRFGWLLWVLRGFVLVAIGALILFVMMPELIEQAGAGVLVAMLAGMALPVALERLGEQARDKTRALVVGTALMALLLHALLDGVALGTHGESHHLDLALAVALVLHRLPVGLAVWMFVAPRYGERLGWGVLGLVGLATGVGFGLGELNLSSLGGGWLAFFQAFVAGSLLHVLAHQHLPDEEEEAAAVGGGPLWEVAGGALAVVLVWALPHEDHGHAHEAGASHWGEVGHRFLDLALAVAPALLVGYLLAGLVRVMLKGPSRSWLKGGSALTQPLRGALFGATLCACDTLPRYRRMVGPQAVPPAAALGFLVASPALGVEAMLLSFPLLGAPMTLVRVGATLTVALVAGWLVARMVSPSVGGEEGEDVPSAAVTGRFGEALRFGFGKVVDETAAWILAGLALAAALGPDMMSPWLGGLPAGADVVIFALLGVPLYLCASGATPIAAALILTGASPGAALAFLLTGPTTSATTFGALARRHGRVTALTFSAVVVSGAVALGALTNQLLAPHPLPFSLEESPAHPLSQVALGLLGLVFMASISRQGPTHFIEPVIHLDSRDHSEDHTHP